MFHNKPNFITKFLFAVSFIVLGAVAAANAQAPGTALKFNAENAFALKGKVFPAGEYSISRMSDAIWSSDLLVLRGKGVSAIFSTTQTNSLDPATESAVIFNKIDGTNFLAQIRLSGETAGKSINISKADVRQIAKVKRKNSNTDTAGL